MKRSVWIILLIHLSASCAYGQTWRPEQWMITTPDPAVGLVSPGYTQAIWSWSGEGEVIVGNAGGSVIRSTNGGKSWSKCNTGIQTSLIGSFSHAVSDQGVVYVSFTEGGVPNTSYMARSKDFGETFEPLTTEGGSSFGPSMSQIHLALGDLVIAGPHSLGRYWISTDAGETWSDTLFSDPFNGRRTSALVKYNVSPVYQSGGHRTAVIQDSSIYESSDGGRSWSRALLPSEAVWHRYLPWGVLCAVVDTSGAMTFLRSTDWGVSWDTSRTLEFSNSTVVGEIDYPVACVELSGGLRLWLRSGFVCTLLDDGTTWVLNGESERFSGGVRQVGYGIDGTLFVTGIQWIHTCEPGLHDTVRVIGPSMVGIVLQLRDGSLLAKQRSGILRSKGVGNDWVAATRFDGYPEEFEPREYIGVQPFRVNTMRLTPQRSVFTLSSDRLTEEVRVAKSKRDDWIWKVDFSNPRTWRFSPSSYVAPSLVEPSKVSAGYRRSVSGIMYWSKDGGATLLDTLNRPYMLFASVLNDGSIVVLADSIYVSSDTGATWISLAENGLFREAPFERIRVVEALGDPSGRMYIGLDGTVFEDASVESYRNLGGIWYTDDGGATWTLLEGMEGFPNVFTMGLDSSGVLYAASTLRTSDLVTGLVKDYHTVLFSSDASMRMQPVHDEYYSAAPYDGSHSIGCLPAGNGVMYASMYDGVLHSRDRGASWRSVGDSLLTGRVIFGLLLDEDRLIASTDQGMYTIDLPTDVEEIQGGDGVPYTSVWCYPNPAKQSLIVRLNNLNLVKSTAISLKVYSTLGDVVDDLTGRIRGSELSERFEFSLDLTEYSSGTYVISLEAGKHSDNVAFVVVE